MPPLGAAAMLACCASAQAAENYVVDYAGAPPGLTEKLRRMTNLSLERRPYPTAAAIRRIGIEDLAIVKGALTAAGYYAAEIDFRIEGETDEVRMRAIFDIAPGAKFRVVEHRVEYRDAINNARPASFDEAGVGVSDRADGATLETNQQRFLSALWAQGYPSARIVARRAEARVADGVAAAVYTFESGPRATFNGVAITGAERTDPEFISNLKTWEDGDIFDREKLITFRDRLAGAGIFSTIDIEPGVVDMNGAAPVNLIVTERKRRTVGAGLSYSTSEGPGGRLFLEYRNLFGRGERARAEIKAAEINQSIDFSLTKPLPGFPGSAYANFGLTNETTDAFSARTIEISGGLAKAWFDDRLETRAGLALETSKVEPELARTATVREERNYFVSVPLSATWNTEDDPLKLTKGAKASLFAIPYFGSDQFTRLEAVARSRTHFGGDDRFTLAGRVRVAATAGQGLQSLPVNKRVFAGGGSSVRGYDFQAVGPLDPNGVPVGGRSAVEAAVEARARILRRVEIAAFADAGAVYAESFPDFNGDYLVGAGLGVRYLSTIGPIRLDVATPLEKRPTDRDFQFYISLGQPF